MTTDYKLWLKYSKTQIAEAWSETKCEKKYTGIKEMNRNKCKLKWVARVMLRRGKRKIVWFDASNNTSGHSQIELNEIIPSCYMW